MIGGMKRSDILNYTDALLNIKDYQDYGPNGLQIQGKEDIKQIAFAVSATKDSIEKAVSLGADLLFVHHGLFWKFHGAKALTGPFYNRVAPLIKNDMNLVGYHLPLDGHITLGNAASLAKLIELSDLAAFGDYKGMPTGVWGKLANPMEADTFCQKLESILNHKVIHAMPNQEKIKTVGIITGGANSDWIRAKDLGLDAYITGEISEHDWHEAIEAGIHFFAGGHNATEQFGIQALMHHLQHKFGDQLEYHFIASHNPA